MQQVKQCVESAHVLRQAGEEARQELDGGGGLTLAATRWRLSASQDRNRDADSHRGGEVVDIQTVPGSQVADSVGGVDASLDGRGAETQRDRCVGARDLLDRCAAVGEQRDERMAELTVASG